MIALQIIFWISVALVLHSYIFFPSILSLLAKKRKLRWNAYQDNELPEISVLISAFNEESVIEKKIRSVIGSEYPSDKTEILIGSDASTDKTNAIIKKLEQKQNNLKGYFFERRQGKPNIINQLATKAKGEILIITDANVMLEKNTLRELVKYFKSAEIGVIDTRMINLKVKKVSISEQEKFYIDREVRIKHHESVLWGCMMGPFGGCFAVRKTCFRPVPANYLVDDFYISMSALDQKMKCISNLDAKVYEDVSHDISEEFRRKTRISAGNFQNLRSFSHLLIPRMNGVAFCFFSHKFLRWIVPFLAIITLSASIILGLDSAFYRVVAIIHGAIIILPLIDHFLRKIKIQIIPLRFISHFIVMNLALMAGFMRFIRGVRSNVWKPTERYQK